MPTELGDTNVGTAVDVTLVDLNELRQSDQPTGTSPAKLSPHSRVASLIYIHPNSPDLGRRLIVADEPVTIGRSHDCQFSISNSSLSRFHARIEQDVDGHHVVVDLMSTNGTFVNDVRAERTLLQDGDHVRVGSCILRYLGRGNVEADYHEEIYRLTVLDPLTGIHNRRFLMETLSREVARAHRHRRPLSLALFDIDHFKRINDEYGHLIGDWTLREIAHRVKEQLRADETFARFGGEEFAVVLTESDVGQAALFGERVRALVEANPFSFEESTFPITVSVGVAELSSDESDNETRLMSRADQKLYEAKRAGRNRVES